MSKYFKFFEYAYLAFAAFFIFETIRIWDIERDRAYIFIFFACISIFMFFFKRRFRKKLKDRNK